MSGPVDPERFVLVECWECGGDGERWRARCYTCGGRGWVEDPLEMIDLEDLDVMAGTADEGG